MENRRYFKDRAKSLAPDEALNVTQTRSDGTGLRKVKFNPSTAKSIVQVPYHKGFVFNLNHGYEGLDNFLYLQGYDRAKIDKIHQSLGKKITSPRRRKAESRDASPKYPGYVTPNVRLERGYKLYSPNGQYSLEYRENDAVLVINENNKQIVNVWDKGTIVRYEVNGGYIDNNNPGKDCKFNCVPTFMVPNPVPPFCPNSCDDINNAYLVFQSDGNFVLYHPTLKNPSDSSKPRALWVTGPQSSNSFLFLGDDGILTIYGNNKIQWMTSDQNPNDINYVRGYYSSICSYLGICDTNYDIFLNVPQFKSGYDAGENLANNLYRDGKNTYCQRGSRSVFLPDSDLNIIKKFPALYEKINNAVNSIYQKGVDYAANNCTDICHQSWCFS